MKDRIIEIIEVLEAYVISHLTAMAILIAAMLLVVVLYESSLSSDAKTIGGIVLVVTAGYWSVKLEWQWALKKKAKEEDLVKQVHQDHQ